MSRLSTSVLRHPALVLLAIVGLLGIACNEDGSFCTSTENDLNGEYYNMTYDFSMALVHDCGSGNVVGTFYDGDDFAYALTGNVTDDKFAWEARRDRPSGGSDLFYSPGSGMTIASLGLSFSGRVLKNGIGPAGGTTFELQE